LNIKYVMVLLLILLNIIGVCHAQTPPVKHEKNKLTLHLSTAKASQDKVALTITLQNTTNEKVSIWVPSNPGPLSVVLLTSKGRKYALDQLLKFTKDSTNFGRTMIIKPKEKITYKRSFDLTEFRTEIVDKTSVEFRARFGFTLNSAEQEKARS
jgi:hypothetical protein